MMQPYPPGWPPMGGQLAPPRRNRRRGAAIGAAFILMVCWLAGLTSTPAGLLTIGLVFAVVYLLASHRRDGTALRALAEYGTVALLVALAMVNAGHTPKVHRPAPPTRVSLEQARQSIIDGWQNFATGFTAPPDEGRRR